VEVRDFPNIKFDFLNENSSIRLILLLEALLTAASGRATVADGDCGTLPSRCRRLAHSDFTWTTSPRQAERRSGQVSFISEQSVSAAFERRHGQASFTLGEAAAGALRALGPRGPRPELLQLVVMPVLRLLPLLLNLLLSYDKHGVRGGRGGR
jgi:hypothetical protein